MATIDWAAIREKAIGPFTLAALPANLQLPALPYAVTKFIEASSKDDAVPKDLAAIVETDTGLTVDLLRFVNSARQGLRTRCSNVLQAITLLGLRQAKLFVITNGTRAAIRSRKSKLVDQTCFWNSSLQKAIFAKEMAALLGTDGDLAFAGALLQDFLLPVLTNDVFEKYVDFVENRRMHAESLSDFEQIQFGWDHGLAAACMAHRWKLPDELVCCLYFHHRGLRLLSDPVLSRTSVAAVGLSALLPDQLRQQFTGLEQLVLLEKKWPRFQLGPMIRKVDAIHAEMGAGIQNDFPLARRCKVALELSELGLDTKHLELCETT